MGLLRRSYVRSLLLCRLLLFRSERRSSCLCLKGPKIRSHLHVSSYTSSRTSQPLPYKLLCATAVLLYRCCTAVAAVLPSGRLGGCSSSYRCCSSCWLVCTVFLSVYRAGQTFLAWRACVVPHHIHNSATRTRKLLLYKPVHSCTGVMASWLMLEAVLESTLQNPPAICLENSRRVVRRNRSLLRKRKA